MAVTKKASKSSKEVDDKNENVKQKGIQPKRSC